MNLLDEGQTIRVSVPVENHIVVTIIDAVYYNPDSETVNVDYHFDEDFYMSDNVEFLNARRMNLFEQSLNVLVSKNLQKIIQRENFKNAAR